MIKYITAYEECSAFAAGFQGDTRFSDPMLCSEEQIQCNLVKSIERPDCDVLGIFREGRMIGLFALLVLPNEKYIEMLVGLSREKEAYLELLHYMGQRWLGFCADFVFNPGNYILKELLDLRGAEYEPEQQKMVLGTPPNGIWRNTAPFTTRICIGRGNGWHRRRNGSAHFWRFTMGKSLATWM